VRVPPRNWFAPPGAFLRGLDARTRPSSSMSGVCKQSRVALVRHRQPKGPETARASPTPAPYVDSTPHDRNRPLSVETSSCPPFAGQFWRPPSGAGGRKKTKNVGLLMHVDRARDRRLDRAVAFQGHLHRADQMKVMRLRRESAILRAKHPSQTERSDTQQSRKKSSAEQWAAGRKGFAYECGPRPNISFLRGANVGHCYSEGDAWLRSMEENSDNSCWFRSETAQ
jgi:hypothetical protein